MRKLITIALLFIAGVAYSQTTPIPAGSTARAGQFYQKNDSLYINLGAGGNYRLPIYQDAQYKAGLTTILQRNAIPLAFRKEGMAAWVGGSVDSLYILKNGITNADWVAFSSGSGGGGTWGSITGTISSQTDLIALVGLKVDKTITVNGHALSSNVTISKSDVGLGSVDNTPDISKPVSTATQTALNLKANTSTVLDSLTAHNTRLSAEQAARIAADATKAPVSGSANYINAGTFPVTQSFHMGTGSGTLANLNVNGGSSANIPFTVSTKRSYTTTPPNGTTSVLITDSSAFASQRILFKGVFGRKMASIDQLDVTGAVSDLAFFTSISTDSLTEKMRIKSTGQIQLGVQPSIGASTDSALTIDASGHIHRKMYGGGSGGGSVSSVFGRTGVVVATSGDYAVAQITGLLDSLSNKANKDFSNVASAAIPQVKVSGLVSDLALKQPLEDQRLSTTNTPSFISLNITGTGGNGYIGLAANNVGSIPSPSSGVNFFGNSNTFGFKNVGGFGGGFNSTNLTSNAIFYLPDVGNLKTLATLDGGQTFTSGVWNGTAIADSYISSASIWNAKVSTEADPVVKAISGIVKSNGTAISAATPGTDYTTPSSTETQTNKSISGTTNTLSNIPQSAVTNLTTDLSGKQATSAKDATGGYVGLTLFGHNILNGAGANNSLIKSIATTGRTYKLQDKSYTSADSADVDRIRYAVYPVGSAVNFFGTSFFQSQQATSTAYGTVAIFNSTTKTTANNYSVSARDTYQAIVNAYTNIGVQSTVPTIALLGFNDLRRGGSASATIEKIKSATRALLANNFLFAAVAANNAAVTAAGTWTASAPAYSKAATGLAGSIRSSGATGSTLSYTFTGSTLVIGTFSTDQTTTTGGDFTYNIDGTGAVTYTGKFKTDGISDGANDNSIVPNAIVIQGLSSGSHTVIITASETAPARIDYFGTLQAPQAAPAVVIGSVPKMNSTGYAISPASGSDAVFLAGSEAMKSVVAEFSQYPAFFVDVNSFYNVATGLGADNIHPNDTGYKQLAQAFLSMVRLGAPAVTNPITLTDGTGNNTYLGSYTDYAQSGVNRNPITGVFTNTSKAAAQYSIYGGSADGHHEWYTASANNTSPTNTMTLNKNGQLSIFGGTTGSSLRVGPSSANTGGYITGVAAGQILISGGVEYLGGAWVARATSASLVSIDAGNFTFYGNTGLTAGNSFTPTAYASLNPSGAYFAQPSGAGAVVGRVQIGVGSATIPQLFFDSQTTAVTASSGRIGGHWWNSTTGRLNVVDAAATTKTYAYTSDITAGSSGFSAAISTKTANYTALATDYTIKVDATTGNMTVTLPAVASNIGRILIIKKIDATANTVTLDGNASETIDGALTQVISTQWGVFRIQSDGTTWSVL